MTKPKSVTSLKFNVSAISNVLRDTRRSANARRDATISALYYTLNYSDASCLKGMTKDDAKLFTPALRSFLPVVWDKSSETYKFNGAKADKSREMLSTKDVTLERGKISVDVLFDAVLAYQPPVEELSPEEQKAADEAKVAADAKAVTKYVNKKVEALGVEAVLKALLDADAVTLEQLTKMVRK